MALSSIELWQRISAEGLASPMQCRTWAADVAQNVQAADTTDGLKVLQALIELGRLTPYQAKILAGQSDRPLHRGSWTILSRVNQPLWQGWLAVTKVDLTKAESPPATWARWLSADELQTLKSSAPSLPRGLQLASVQHENLQTVFVPELADSELQMQVAPVRGELLTQVLDGKPLEPNKVTNIIRQLASALAAMHAAGLVHGRVLPDRVYLDEDFVTLARDPISVLTATLEETAVGVLGEHMQGMRSTQFLAPEFVAPGQLPTIASDVYALGCTWWWLLTGKPLVEGASAQEILARHTEASLELPTDCEYPEPLTRCLKHCLAKNLDARFKSANELREALEEAQKVTAVGKVVRADVATAEQSPRELAPAKSSSKPDTKATTEAPRAQSTARTSPKQRVAAKVAEAKSNVSDGAGDQRRTKGTGESKVAAPLKNTSEGKRKIVPAVAIDDTAASVPAELKSTDDSPQDLAKPQVKPAATEPIAKAHPAPESEAQTLPEPSGGANTDSTGPVSKVARASDSQSDGSRSDAHQSANQPTDASDSKQDSQAKAGKLQAASRAATKPLAEKPSAAKQPLRTSASSSAGVARRRKTRKRGNKWLLPVVGGCGFVILMLLVLKLSGALEPSAKKPSSGGGTVAYVPPASTGTGEIIERNPLLDYFNIVEDPQQLWVPPAPPAPLQLDMLPPGGQLFVSFRPATLLSGTRRRSLLSVFDEQLTPLLEIVARQSGKPLESIRQVTVGFYSAESSGALPQFAMRVELNQATPLSSLKSGWENPTKAKLNEQELLVNDADLAYYVLEQPLVDAQSIAAFSVGPVGLMREVAEMGGGSGPLTSQMEALRKRTDRESDLSILLSPRYLFSEGRGLLDRGPERLRQVLTGILGNDTRAALLQTRLEPTWYLETQIVGASDRDAPGLIAAMYDELRGAPEAIENWFVDESPHTYWRALALRYPQMLRTAAEYSRFGVEDGTAIMNAYLSPEAALNLTLASWIAMQPSATLQADPSAVVVAETVKPLTIEEYLGRKIRLSFDLEPIEDALSLVAEEANAGLPGDTPQMRFTLDGDAFEKGGITRNQQLSDFNMNGKSVREALTEIAKRGNTDRTVTDIRNATQNLIWVVTDDPESPGKKMISLTTRVAANAGGIPLPDEFAPAAE